MPPAAETPETPEIAEIAEATGYTHPAYAGSLAEIGEPRRLPASAGWLLVRAIPGSPWRDGLGPYPLFACRDWSRLGDDLEALAGELVAVCLVTDPFAEADEAGLRRAFPDLARRFKEHFVVDLARPAVSAHHRRNLRRALSAVDAVEVERCAEPRRHLDEWCALYGALVERHGIHGIPAFSRAAFAAQLEVPGLVALRAVRGGETVAMTLWFEQEGRAYYHLGAASPEGYRAGASFALFAAAIARFREAGLEWLDLGAGAGAHGPGSAGLARFKRGWATGTRPAWLCGRVLDRERYRELVAARGGVANGWFPAYRQGEDFG